MGQNITKTDKPPRNNMKLATLITLLEQPQHELIPLTMDEIDSLQQDLVSAGKEWKEKCVQKIAEFYAQSYMTVMAEATYQDIVNMMAQMERTAPKVTDSGAHNFWSTQHQLMQASLKKQTEIRNSEDLKSKQQLEDINLFLYPYLRCLLISEYLKIYAAISHGDLSVVSEFQTQSETHKPRDNQRVMNALVVDLPKNFTVPCDEHFLQYIPRHITTYQICSLRAQFSPNCAPTISAGGMLCVGQGRIRILFTLDVTKDDKTARQRLKYAGLNIFKNFGIDDMPHTFYFMHVLPKTMLDTVLDMSIRGMLADMGATDVVVDDLRNTFNNLTVRDQQQEDDDQYQDAQEDLPEEDAHANFYMPDIDDTTSEKEERRQVYANHRGKRQKGKLRTLYKKYDELYMEEKIENRTGGYFGDLDADVESVYQLLIQQGYVPVSGKDSLQRLPTSLIGSALQSFVTGHGLQCFHKLCRENAKALNDTGSPKLRVSENNSHPNPGFKVRKFLMKAILLYHTDLEINRYISEFCKSARAHMENALNKILKRAEAAVIAKRVVDTVKVEVPQQEFTTSTATTSTAAQEPSFMQEKGKEFAQGLKETMDVERTTEKIGDTIVGKIKDNSHEIGKGIGAGVMDGLSSSLKAILGDCWTGMKEAVGKAWKAVKESKHVIYWILAFVIGGIILSLLGYGMYRLMFPSAPHKECGDEKQLAEEEAHAGVHFADWIAEKFMSAASVEVSHGPKRFSETKFGSWLKTAESLFTFTERFDKFTNVVVKYVKGLIDWFHTQLYKRPYFADSQALFDWKDQIKKMMDVVFAKTQDTEDSRREYVRNYETLVQVSRVNYGRNEPSLNASIMSGLKEGYSKYMTYRATLVGDKRRQEPLSAFIKGDPNTGKSFAEEQIPNAIFSYLQSHTETQEAFQEIGAQRFSDTLVYPRKEQNEFWETYENQWVTHIDDIFQNILPEVRGLEALSVIAMKNSAPYMLHMPGVAEKGQKYFTSKLLMMTSNIPDTELANIGITDYRAFLRRRDFIIEPFHAKPKVPENAGTIAAFATMGFRVQKLNLETGTFDKETVYLGVYGWTQLIEDMAKRYLHYREVSLRAATPIDYTHLWGKVDCTGMNPIRLREYLLERTDTELHDTLESFLARYHNQQLVHQTMVKYFLVEAETLMDGTTDVAVLRLFVKMVKSRSNGSKYRSMFDEMLYPYLDELVEIPKTTAAPVTEVLTTSVSVNDEGEVDLDPGTGVGLLESEAHCWMDFQCGLFGAKNWTYDLRPLGNVPNALPIPQYPAWLVAEGGIDLPLILHSDPRDERSSPPGEATSTFKRVVNILANAPAHSTDTATWRNYQTLRLLQHTFGIIGGDPEAVNFLDPQVGPNREWSIHQLFDRRQRWMFLDSLVISPGEVEPAFTYVMGGRRGEFTDTVLTGMREKWIEICRVGYISRLEVLSFGAIAIRRLFQSGRILLGAREIETFYQPAFPDRSGKVARMVEMNRITHTASTTAGFAVGVAMVSAGLVAIYAFLAVIAAIVTTLILAGLVKLGLLAAAKYSKWMKPTKKAHSSEKIQQYHQRLQNKRKPDTRGHMEEQEAHFSQSTMDALQRCGYNTYFAQFNFVETPINSSGYMLNLGKNIWVFPNHYIVLGTLREITIVETLSKGKDWYAHTVLPKDMIINRFPSRDLVFAYFPGFQPSKKLITSFGRKRTDKPLDSVHGACRVDVIANGDDDVLKLPCTQEAFHYLENPNGVLNVKIDLPPIGKESKKTLRQTINQCYTVPIPSEKGKCGSAVCSTNDAVQDKFVGIVIAGTSKTTTIAPVYREDVEEFAELVKKTLSSLPEEVQEAHGLAQFSEAILPPSCKFVEVEGEGSYEGVKIWSEFKNVEYSIPQKTELSPTIVQTGIDELKPPYPDLLAPAMLRPKDGIDPLHLSWRKGQGRRTWFNMDLMAKKHWAGIFNDSLKTFEHRILTITEGVMGIPTRGNFHSIDLKTGAGHPWRGMGYARSDLVIFDADKPNCTDFKLGEKPELGMFEPRIGERGLWIHPEVQWMIYMRFYFAKLGLVVPAYFIYCLKDETRPIDRVAMGYTRGFMASGLDHLIFCRMVLGLFVSYVESEFLGDSALGVNPFSHHWERMYRKLCAMSRKVVAADVDGWDTKFPSLPFTIGFMWIYTRWTRIKYKGFDYLCVESVLISSLCPFIVVKRVVIILMRMPSGAYVTAIFNTIFNSAKHRHLWYIRYDVEFDEYNALDCSGDDSVLAIKEEILEEWNGQVLAELAKKYWGHTHTDSSKSLELQKWENIEDIYFLQRKFKDVEGVILAPLNPRSIYGMVQWNGKPKDVTPQKLFCDVTHGAIREFALHGKYIFEAEKKTLNEFLMKVNPSYYYDETWAQRWPIIVQNAKQ